MIAQPPLPHAVFIN